MHPLVVSLSKLKRLPNERLPNAPSPSSDGEEAGITQSWTTRTIIRNAGDMDILCGQDKTFNMRPGNQTFKEVISTYSNIYRKASASKRAKMKITREIVEYLQTVYNARFLRPVPDGNDEGYEVVSQKMARDKVSHALRWALLGDEGKQRARERRRKTPRRDSTSSFESSSSGSGSSASGKTGLADTDDNASGTAKTLSQDFEPTPMPSIPLRPIQSNGAKSDSVLFSPDERQVVGTVSEPRIYSAQRACSLPGGIRGRLELASSTSTSGSAEGHDGGGAVVNTDYIESLLQGPLLDDDSFILDA